MTARRGPEPAEDRPSEVRLVPVASLRVNPDNPRSISKPMFERLKASMEADPAFLWSRPILADADGLVYAGNMRLRAAVALGREVVPAVLEDIGPALARMRMLADNNSWGEYEDEKLAEMIYAMRQDGADLALTGFEDEEIARILAAAGAEGGTEQPAPAEVKCPACGNSFVPPPRARG